LAVPTNENGAFTGTVATWNWARHESMFLDEIGELSIGTRV
jgi:transcriptional regulator with PAS, ATPase and Fis domain